MQGTFIGVLMSATLPARLGEPSRALILARRLGRARETLPVVLGTMVSQTLLNLLALAVLGGVTLSSVGILDGHDRPLLLIALAPLARSGLAGAARAAAIPPAAVSRSRRRQALLAAARGRCCACAMACASFASPAGRPSRPRPSSVRGRCSGCPAGCC